MKHHVCDLDSYFQDFFFFANPNNLHRDEWNLGVLI